MQVRLAHRNWNPVGAMYVVYQIEWFQSNRQGNVTEKMTADLLGRLFPYSSACTPMESHVTTRSIFPKSQFPQPRQVLSEQPLSGNMGWEEWV
jgi:hypothetical protein